MSLVVLGAVSGWMIVALVATNISLPYLLRGRLLAANGWNVPYLERIRPHYWIGVTVAGLSLVHAGLAMSMAVRFDPLSTAGLWVGTGGMLIAFAQAMVGMRMRTLRGAERVRLRRLHFRFMLALVATGVIHIVLNRPL
ncbi:MAG TPA: hypothetical protein VHO95_04655 [Candidatus Dormibacteraeota bacterium]|jgi:drug/metabolite transporter (DMT)-like permease|nr:hypothetical protein [Candidatus Dormibacteraeota bacterium]